MTIRDDLLREIDNLENFGKGDWEGGHAEALEECKDVIKRYFDE